MQVGQYLFQLHVTLCLKYKIIHKGKVHQPQSYLAYLAFSHSDKQNTFQQIIHSFNNVTIQSFILKVKFSNWSNLCNYHSWYCKSEKVRQITLIANICFIYRLLYLTYNNDPFVTSSFIVFLPTGHKAFVW